ncbi:hypothetical protein EW026_g1295 [Hermanssonia centrifuga]|uniref:Uncharacterized protein n=1 Tax=Hermanssonia centrifuga TaxID=98765 RepID=A0A4S4KSU5_9APHY|nr:hypothetical protein EW026_g1295 [Hermanssonia centrifuga]
MRSLSGVVTMQVYLYYSIYPKDGWYFKSVVTVIWFVDLLHTLMASAANWSYLIVNFGFVDINDHITWSIAVTVALTALMTFLVQM